MPRRAPTGLPLLVAITLTSLSIALFAAWFIVIRPAGDDSADTVDVDSFLSNDGTIAEEGQPAPVVEFEGLDRPDILLAEMKGRIVVINFWASTCVPCVKEMPLIEEVSQGYDDDEVSFVGVSVNEDLESARKMIDSTGVTYAQARDTSGTLIRQFGGIALPHTVVIDRDGNVAVLANQVISDAKDLTDMIDSAT